MKFEDRAAMMEHMGEIGIYLEWVDVILHDLLEGFLIPLAHGGNEYSTATLVKCEAESMETKAEMLDRFLSVIGDHYHAMQTLVFNPEPMPDHSTMTDAEREAEITGDIIKAVEKIALHPDWLEKLKLLNYVAWELATGDTTKT